MTGKLILYYVALMFFTTWAGSLLVRASGDLCRGNPYRNPNKSDSHGKRKGKLPG